MKTRTLLLLLGFWLSFSSQAQNNIEKCDSVKVITEVAGAYQYQNFYLSAQPNLEAMRWYRSQGVEKVINLRTEKENKSFTASAFHEKNMVEELGMEYLSLPVGGANAYSPERLELFAEAMKGKGKVLIHCRSAGRVTNLFMAYLVKYKGYSLNQAIEIGRQVKFSFPLEKLLGEGIRFTTEK